ncbi:hypothetical protein [Hymenobacter actinosclerus]|uniref:Uncharacterized protein n=1 Tax=Hymenobacter actinosclerus TaxID=82805 RepID=A0A1H9ZSJ5_9BACT|nr:hypothetical protein [Hymenobacter actinosclerus]SES83790.1 hypothetical protein SAMN04487998_0426 [Hymenobacter actinosclerus]
MAWPPTPATRRLVAWLFLTAGFLLVLGVSMQLWIMYEEFQRLGNGGVSSTALIVRLMMLVAAVMMLRYGWREVRGNDTVD